MMRYLFLCVLLPYVGFCAMDLEKNQQDFVLETRKIEIPGYPHAFNPSIVRWNGSLLMSFRIIPDRKASFTSYIGLIWLDDEFMPISEPQILDARVELKTPSRAEDGRLVAVGERLYMVYDDNLDVKITKGGFRVFVAEVACEKGSFSLKDVENLVTFDGASDQRREKSWTPFDYRGDLMLAYSLDPHLIFRPIGQGQCETIASTKGGVDWNWGPLRGGTPALAIDGQYLAFFHSCKEMESVQSKNEKSLHYFIGAYTFNIDPPFEIEKISPVPIIAKGFYHHTGFKPYWHPVRAVFPCGYIVDNDSIWVAYGREDHEVWVVRLDKKRLLNSLKDISRV